MKLKKLLCALLTTALLLPSTHISADTSSDIDDTKWVFNNHTYEIVNVPEGCSWIEAEEMCENRGGHLATVSSEDEQQELYSHVLKLGDARKNNYWIGLYFNDGTNDWSWVTDEEVTYTHWASGEPNNYNNNLERFTHLVGIDYNASKVVGAWNDAQVNGAPYASDFYLQSGYGYICEWDAELVTYKENCPIIIVPGVMGSRLYEDANCTKQLWDPSKLAAIGYAINPFSSLGKKMDFSQTLYIKNNLVNQNSITEDREYGAQDTYKRLVDTLCKEFPTRDVYFFSYDFRNDNAKNAQLLNEEIQTIIKDKWDRVDLVCHSMGGLVTSSYAAQYGSKHIRNVFTLGTPYEGAPKLVNAVLNWDALTNRYEDSWGILPFNADTLADMVLGLGGLQKKVKAGFPALAQLAGTESYVNQIPSYEKVKKGWFSTQQLQINYAKYKEKLITIFGDKYTKAEEFHKNIKPNGFNALLNLKNSYFAVGTNQATIKALVFNEGTTLSKIECTDLLYEYTGDGTVPYESSTMLNNINTRKDAEHFVQVSDTHTGLVSNSSVLKWITEVIGEEDVKTIPTVEDMPGFVVIRVACPVDVKIERNNEVLDSSKGFGSTETSFGRIDYIGGDSDIKMLCLKADEAYSINLAGTETGTMDLTIRSYNGNGTIQREIGYEDVAITKDTKMVTTTADDNITLSIDNNGDGTVDTTSQAIVNDITKMEVPEQPTPAKTTAKAPKKTSITKIKKIKKNAKISWKKVTSAKGYQIQYSTSKKFKKAKTKTVSGSKKTSITIKKLAKKKYYFRIRTYNTSNGKKKYSSWSGVKSKKM